MPATGATERSKRKRDSKAAQPNKKSKAASSDDEMEDAGAEILLLEQGILESRKNYNDITKLLETMAGFHDGRPESMLAAVALCRIFMRLLAQGSLTPKKGASEKDTVVTTWLRAQFVQYKLDLAVLLKDEDVASTVLTLCMRLLKAEGEHLDVGGEYKFPWAFLENIIATMVTSNDEEVMNAYIEEYAEQYDDIRFYTFQGLKRELEKLSKSQTSKALLFDRAFALLSALDGVPENAEELEDFYVPQPTKKTHQLFSIHKHKLQGQAAWLALMSVAETKDQKKKILEVISTVVAPWFQKPELLADFLTNSYDTGGSMSLLALSGVFYLIQKRNLDYPSFYEKLYSLLDRDILHSKHRSRFFRLMDTFLGSTHLPAALVASFVKRLCRLALNAPPSAIVFIVPWLYNIFKHHPLCSFMIQRDIRDEEMKKQIEEQGATDPYDPEEVDPMKTRAIDSSLWEIIQLQSHYHPNVATITKIVSEQFTKQAYNMEDFLDHSYASLLEAEMAKEVKKAPVVEFQIPKKVLLPQEEPAVTPDNLIARLWDFGGASEQIAA